MKEDKNDIERYLTQLKNVHKIPIIIGEYGVPSSRNSGDFNTDINKGYINEEEQGKTLVDAYKSIKNAKIAGSFIFELQDSWHRTSWNTKESKILDRSPFWSDAQDWCGSRSGQFLIPATVRFCSVTASTPIPIPRSVCPTITRAAPWPVPSIA